MVSAGIVYASERLSLTVNSKLFASLVDGLQFYGTIYYYTAVTLVLALWGAFTIKKTDNLSLVQVERKVFEGDGQK